MKKSVLKNNKGYSLIELVIVIAIIAILAAMALVSVTIIHSARAKDSALKLDSEVAEVLTKSKNMTPGSDLEYSLVVYRDSNDKVNICQATFDKNSGTYTLDTESNIVLPSQVNVSFNGVNYKDGTTSLEDANKSSKYNGSDDKISADSDEYVHIRFDKKGSCLSGYGLFKFYKKNGNVVSKVTIRQNGSHEVK